VQLITTINNFYHSHLANIKKNNTNVPPNVKESCQQINKINTVGRVTEISLFNDKLKTDGITKQHK